jgi:hypothetical protein
MAMLKHTREYQWMTRQLKKERDQQLYQPHGRPRLA